MINIRAATSSFLRLCPATRDINVSFCLTLRCNLTCSYCYRPSGATRADMPPTVLADAVRLLEETPCRRMHLVLFGGEPLMAMPLIRQTIDLIQKSSALQTRTTLAITTNACLLTESASTWLRQAGCDLSVSVHASEPRSADHVQEVVDEWIHSRPGQNAIRRAHEVPNTVAVVVLTPSVARVLDEFVKCLIDRTPFRNLVLNPDYSQVWSNDGLQSVISGYERLSALIVKQFRAGSPISVNTVDAKIRTLFDPGCFARYRCTRCRRTLAVSVDGILYPCERYALQRATEFSLGSVTTGIDGYQARAAYRKATLTEPACAHCDLGDRCLNWCFWANEHSSGEPSRPGSAVCTHEHGAAICADMVTTALLSARDNEFLRRHGPKGVESWSGRKYRRLERTIASRATGNRAPLHSAPFPAPHA
jgi:uncharacterized protein